MKSTQTHKLAIIDIGSSSSKLKIYEYSSNTINKLFVNQKLESNLGQNVQEGKTISRKTVKRQIGILRAFLKEINMHGITSITVIATDVLRKAKNSKEVLKRIYETTELKTNIVNQKKEAELFWLGITSDLDVNKNKPIIAFDIGGGSVQIMFGRKSSLKEVYLFSTGAVTLYRKFIKNDPAKVQEYKNLEKFIYNQIKKIKNKTPSNSILFHGSSSIIDLYSEAGFKMKNSEISNSHPFIVNLKETRRMYTKLSKLTLKKREEHFPSQPFFMDAVCVGLIYILTIGKIFNAKYEIPSNNSICDGIIHLQKERNLANFLKTT